MRLFDTHCHLQDERIIAQADRIIVRARNANVVRLLCCGTSESDWQAVKKLSLRYPEVVPAFGLHPWFAGEQSPGFLETLEALLAEFPGASVGEIGLDHAVEERNDEEQERVFICQLRVARTLGRPVSLHCRKAWGRMMEILEKHYGTPDGGAIHSFSGPPGLVSRLEKLNIAISFSGSITYERNRRGREALSAVPEHLLLVETDSPDIPPNGVEKGANEPAYCAAIIKKMAEIRGVAAESLAEATFINASRIFKTA